MDVLVVAASAVAGIVAGDLAEPLADRLPGHRALDRPWWRCPHCAEPATGSGLVPLVRVAARRLPCASCSRPHPHPWRALVQPLITGLVTGALAVRFGAHVDLFAFDLVGVALVAIGIIDVETRLVPNRLVRPAIALGAVLFVLAAWADHAWTALEYAGIAGAAGYAVFYAVHFVYPQGMGRGDVRLALLVGGATGWLGWRAAVVAFFLSFVSGSVFGVAILVATGSGRKTQIAFAPYLVAGALVMMVFSGSILRALHPVLYPGGS